jgi:hypothetical protein
MAWARVDDGWWCHPKVLPVSLAARGLWASALSWSCAQRSPVVPERFPVMLDAPDELVAELVDAGLWKARPEGGFEIHDWAYYQDLSTREKRQEAGRRGGVASGEARAKQTRSKPKQTDTLTSGNAEANRSKGQANAEAGPSPTQPNPRTYPLPPSVELHVRRQAEARERETQERLAEMTAAPVDPSQGLAQVRSLKVRHG